MQKTNGYDTELFIDNVEDEYLCTLCQHVLQKPMQALCGCRFCAPCVSSAIGTCPSCNGINKQSDFNNDFYARSQLRKKLMFCVNKPIGCTATIKLSDLENHLTDCSYKKVNCVHFKSGCDAKLFRTELQDHLKYDCDYRLVECTYCNGTYTFNDINSHKCKNKPTACPNDCGADELLLKEVDDHLQNECPLVKVTCPFQPMGCRSMISRKDTANHQTESTSEHLFLVLENLEKQNLINAQIRRENEELKSTCHLLLNRLQHSESELKKFKDLTERRFNDLQKKTEQSSKDLTEQIAILNEEQKDQQQCIKEVSARSVNTRQAAAPRADVNVETNIMRVDISELQFKVNTLEQTSYDGTLLWRIPNVDRATREAINGKTNSLYSPPFYSSRTGYKMCLRLYLNGDGMGRNTHVSLFFVIMRGMYDALLPWPFKQNVTLILLDQETGQRSLSDSFRPDPNSSSFQKPKINRDMNVATGCPLFVSKQILRDPTYVRDDTMYIKAIVEQMPVIW
ncbi:TNF receptor-associated factor 3-like [Antedon mediterranea]|uniref:TNF receptor-associated factor 3-like n=1 Tax=Antedon mediterranea TaxID=105859 RepID=UPI003AF6610D